MKIQELKRQDIVFTAPSAKAHTLRAIILASLASGTSKITNPLLGQDQLNLIQCFKNLGVKIEVNDDHLIIEGTNGNFKPVNNVLNCGESGVAMNVLTPICSIVPGEIIITGDPGLLIRPIKEVVSGIEQLGAEVEYLDKEGFPPVKVKSGVLTGTKVNISGSKTSQYFSGISMVAPFAQNDVTLICTDSMSEKPYFDITEYMMDKFSVQLSNNNYKEINIQTAKYKSADVTIEGDFSSASFFMLGAAINKLEMRIKSLNRDSKQGDKEMINYLQAMGCDISWDSDDLIIKGKDLTAITVDMTDTPDLVPPLAIACAFATGTSKLTGVGRLIYKECNRLEAVVSGLKRMGLDSHYDDDNLYIEGNKEILKGAKIDSFNDHRIAMSFAIAGLAVEKQEIDGSKCVAKSFPNFWEEIELFYS
ncbi:MAG: 3-phosphoshikimate 1-carboxyvinyltransferase [Spirochaetaceae bacterium]